MIKEHLLTPSNQENSNLFQRLWNKLRRREDPEAKRINEINIADAMTKQIEAATSLSELYRIINANGPDPENTMLAHNQIVEIFLPQGVDEENSAADDTYELAMKVEADFLKKEFSLNQETKKE